MELETTKQLERKVYPLSCEMIKMALIGHSPFAKKVYLARLPRTHIGIYDILPSKTFFHFL